MKGIIGSGNKFLQTICKNAKKRESPKTIHVEKSVQNFTIYKNI
jgi:hypothetical protein